MPKIPMFIDVKKLHPHPYNPRKDLGDLSELIESIKAQGILQNLTVVPWFSEITRVGCDDPKQQEEMGFRVVIGHRRLAAAKSAGLTELPCMISNMTMNEQLATMMVENMQRQDLTVYEQAHGIQMMLDFGERVLSVSEKTGFSETTVRRRMKLLELDQTKLKAAVDKGIPLADFIELDKIDDLAERNRVLGFIGTNNFRYQFDDAVSRQKRKIAYDKAIEFIKQWAVEATEEEWCKGKNYGTIWNLDLKSLETNKPQDLDTEKYMFQKSNDNNYVSLRRFASEESAESEEEAEKQKAAKEQKLRHDALTDVWNRCQILRAEHIKTVNEKQAKTIVPLVIKHFLLNSFEYLTRPDVKDLSKFSSVNLEELNKIINGNPYEGNIEKILLLNVYLTLDPENLSTWKLPFGWEATYKWDKSSQNSYTRLQEFMEATGYNPSDDEVSLFNGTHELYMPSTAEANNDYEEEPEDEDDDEEEDE